ncbi:MAG: hypothetical protein PHU46_02405 [Rhodocyclaceae bacterium]|nr:hypothetical protein [Rhodocyclaceae bacterium]
MSNKLSRIGLLGLLLAGGLLSQQALADRPEHFERGHDRHWRGNFHEHDLELWRGGRWHQGRHGGRLGWWWIVGGTWYLYSAPVYPYPDPYQPPVVMVEQPQVVPAPPVYAPPPAPVAAPAPVQYWYYCRNPAGYYPYVPQCRGGWQKVPAAPPR